MILYTKDGCFPTRLPNIIYFDDGRIRTNPDSLTQEEIAEAGYTVVPETPDASTYNPYTQRCVWSQETSNWVIEDIPAEEIAREREKRWNGMRHERNCLLADSDFIVIKSLERGEAIPTAWATYRQELRDLPTTYTNPEDVDWPTKPE